MITDYVLRAEIPSEDGTECHDVQVTRSALRALAGAVRGRQGVASASTVVDVEDCGAAYRFLMPLLALTPGRWLLTGTPRLLRRPIEPLASLLQEHGADMERVGNGWLINGNPLKINELTIDASLSSQMASALVLSAPLMGLRTLHLATADIPSLSYLKMTLACTKEYPVCIPGVPTPDIPLGASGDWSAALFWFAHSRLHAENEYRLSPLSIESIQPDSKIVRWFSELRVHVSNRDSSIRVKAAPLEGRPELFLDVRDNLDTVPVMAALAALLPADITFSNVGNLRYKESDRLQALVSQLEPFAEIGLEGQSLLVSGKGFSGDFRPCFDTCHDHRLAMAFLLFGPRATLNDTSCLGKSYPGLCDTLSGLCLV